MTHASDSTAQRDAEPAILARASEYFEKALRPRKITTPEGGKVHLDGIADDNSVIVEAYAHQGDLRGTQAKKVLTDALKLVWVRSWLSPSAQLVVCLSCEEAARTLLWRTDTSRPRSWMAEALRDLGIAVHVFTPGGRHVQAVRAAQEAQYR